MNWKQWMMAGWWATAGLGVVMLLAACLPNSAALLGAAQELLFLDRAAGPITDGVRFAWGVGGAVCLGWALMGAQLTRHAFGEPWAWWAIVASAEVWLITDSAASVLVGAPLNAAINVAFFLAAFGVPLWATRPRAVARAA